MVYARIKVYYNNLHCFETKKKGKSDIIRRPKKYYTNIPFFKFLPHLVVMPKNTNTLRLMMSSNRFET